MKIIKLLTLIYLTLPQICLGARAVVTVLEAPLFRHPNIESTIVQYIRKGTVIYIHNKHIPNPHLDDYKLEGPSIEDIETELIPIDAEEINSLLNNENSLYTIDDFEHKDRINKDIPINFLKTMDKIKRDAYIPAHYVKIIYNTKKEFSESYKLPYDPTDYRLAEPLIKGFPLYNPDKYISDISLTFGPNNTIYYPYPSDIEQTQSTIRSGFKWNYLTSSNLDYENRMHLGGSFNINMQQNRFMLENGNDADELFIDFGIGPSISYDVYKGTDYSTVLSGSLLVNYGRAYVKQTTTDGMYEERMYKGVSFSSNLAILINKKNIIPDALDFFIGIEAQIVLRHRKTATEEFINRSLWNDTTDELYYPTHSNIAVITGIRIITF